MSETLPAKRAYCRGHPIRYDEDRDAWIWADTGRPVEEEPRPCPRCGRMPTPEGHDACLGRIPGATSACCGHGVEAGYIYYSGGTRVPL